MYAGENLLSVSTSCPFFLSCQTETDNIQWWNDFVLKINVVIKNGVTELNYKQSTLLRILYVSL